MVCQYPEIGEFTRGKGIRRSPRPRLLLFTIRLIRPLTRPIFGTTKLCFTNPTILKIPTLTSLLSTARARLLFEFMLYDTKLVLYTLDADGRIHSNQSDLNLVDFTTGSFYGVLSLFIKVRRTNKQGARKEKDH